MLVVVLVCAVIGQSLAATTTAPHTHAHRTHGHHSHPTHEPIEGETFRYIPHGHMMVVMYHKTCWFYSMTSQESTDVHTSTGLHALEAKLVTMIDDTTATYSTMTHNEVMAASKVLARQCNHAGWTAYKLN